ncbi:MAG: restriction endonuclease [Burkholderiaceae bacterium]|nr:restriction endonuclease [Burkholderiaceae bacterium]
MSEQMPTFDTLMNPLLKALVALGGSGSIDEIYEKVLELESISEDIASVPHNPDKSNQSEVAYRLAWARTYLKKYGFLENSSRGVWTLTPVAMEQQTVRPQHVVKTVREADKKDASSKATISSELSWLLKTLLKRTLLGRKSYITY